MPQRLFRLVPSKKASPWCPLGTFVILGMNEPHNKIAGCRISILGLLTCSFSPTSRWCSSPSASALLPRGFPHSGYDSRRSSSLTLPRRPCTTWPGHLVAGPFPSPCPWLGPGFSPNTRDKRTPMKMPLFFVWPWKPHERHRGHRVQRAGCSWANPAPPAGSSARC